jgi:cytochrome c553
MTRRCLQLVALLLAAMAVGGFLVAASGIVPIKASSGHWAVTRWFLTFSMRRSVVTHSLGIETPPLDEPWLVLKGAGHYETGCAPCHGSPVLRAPRIPRGMLPQPEHLPSVAASWKPSELFLVVKHGVKLTGMPAWPALQRDDEVWAMVAFLRALPGLDAEEYRQLVGGPAPAALEETAGSVGASCARCHGADGQGRGSAAFPRLAGQRPAYLAASLGAFARGARHSGIMEPIAAVLGPEEIDALARHYASRSGGPAPVGTPESTAGRERGQDIALHGVPSQGVPACAECHGPSPTRKNAHYPVLAGQYADYLVLQLELFQAGRRGGTAYAHLMRRAADQLTPEQMRDVAAYYAYLPATP